ncbi:MAG: helix-turn-helix domain-containing protein [bacterium]
MSRKNKYSYEEKLRACEDYFYGRRSASQIATDFGLKELTGGIKTWFQLYKTQGSDALLPKSKNSSYSSEFKIKTVEEYINGNGSLREISARYGISGESTLHKWFLQYNSDMKLSDYNPKPEVYMAEARRKTTIEERKEIVEYCINNNRDYKGTAEKYDVSYSQVYSWVKKYNDTGEEGLTDKRGRHKLDEELDELEKLRRENKRLKHQLEERDMTVELLKKVKEIERRRF